MTEHEQIEPGRGWRDRRLTPRYICCGPAQITYLPSDGMLFRGRLRNLGLGGCYIETSSLFPVGARTEVLLQANSLYFRAMAQVRAVREKFGMGLQFIRLSTGGYRALAEVLVELQQRRALIDSSAIYDEGLLAEPNSRLLLGNSAQARSKSLALVQCPPASPLMAPRSNPDSSAILEAHPEILESFVNGSVLDLFG
jgi:hypothetical protein